MGVNCFRFSICRVLGGTFGTEKHQSSFRPFLIIQMKQNYIKRILLCLCLLASLNAFAYDALIDGICYTFSGDNAEVTSGSYYRGTIVIPSSVTYEGKKYSVTNIGSSAFRNCVELTSVTIPNSVTSIGNHAFYKCSGLTSVTIPNSVTSIVDYAFRDCTKLTSITIPDSVTNIGNGAFEGCIELKTIVVEDTNPFFDSRNNCNAIIESATNTLIVGCKNTVIPNDVLSIGEGAFCGCYYLTSLNIPEGVMSIEDGAFQECESLISITIPTTVINIGDYVFCNCIALTSIKVEAGNTNYDSRNNCNAIIETATNTLLSGCKNTTVPNSITSIKWGAFSGCSELNAISIPNSVTSIGEDAFYGCTNLTAITIPSSVTSIGEAAFYGCSGLSTIIIPNSIIVLESSTFSGCSNLKTVTIGNSVKSIESNAFKGCMSITSIVIPNSVTSIGSNAFADCTDIVTVTIGTGVQSIDSYAFTGVSPKKVIWLPKTQPSGYSNSKLKGIVNYVPNESYSGLDNVVIYPYLNSMFEVDGVKYVPVNPSQRTCDAIDCTYNESAKNISVGESVTNRGVNLTIRQAAPYLCYGNTFMENVKLDFKGNINNSAFGGCTDLKIVTIGDNVTGIGDYAFSGCSSLDYFQFGKSIATIGKEAFSGCAAMTELISCAETPPVCGTDALNDIDKWVCMLKVPEGHVATYQDAAQWNEFFFMEAFDPDRIKSIEAEPSSANEVGQFDLQGRRIDKLAKGISIIRHSDGTTRKVLIK